MINNMLLALTPTVNNDCIRLQNVALSSNWDTLRCIGDYSALKRTLSKVGAPYGDPLLCERIANEFNWNLYQNANDWTASLPTAFLKRELEYTTLREASHIMQQKHFSSPDDLFSPRIFSSGQEFADANGGRQDDDIWNNLPVVVSEPIEWVAKYRCVIKNNQLSSWSCYMLNNIYNNPANYKYGNPERFVNSLLDYVDCAKGSVIDVGEIKNRGLAVVETTPIWGAAIYGCDVAKFLDALAASCEIMVD